jgi:hypothetical protein
MVKMEYLTLDVEALDQLCTNCFGKHVKISFRKNTGLDSIQGCIDCAENLSSLLETKISKSFGRRGRGGRGRGRGRGRRGRGRRGAISDAFIGKPKAHDLSVYF